MSVQVALSEAVAPFHVVTIAPVYCRITDAILGSRTHRDEPMAYETFGGATWRANMLNARDYDCDYHREVRDAHGRKVYVPRPEVAADPGDGLPF